ncbi:MAG: peptidase [Crocinitomicaceae bacterium]|nr:peptidase [Crocinitomicaceae bacterium]
MTRLLAVSIVFFLFSINSFSADDSSRTRIQVKAKEAMTYCKKEGLNSQFCILLDMSIHSGKNRIFIYDFKKDSITSTGLCSHGCCESDWGSDWTKDNPTFSNVHESHCSSLGKYKVGKRGYSSWGININYKLLGLEASNSNAYDRLIVLHSWDWVKAEEVYPDGAPEGWGCPAISNQLMKQVDHLLKKSKSPVLLWIYK